MKWVELSKINLPPRATIVRVLPYQASALVVYQVVGRGQQRWVLARWDLQGKFSWEFELSGYPQFFAVEEGLIIVQEPANYSSKERTPLLYAIKLETGVGVWKQAGPILCAAVERGRVYTIEKQPRGPNRLLTRSAETGKRLRRELAYDAYNRLNVSHDLIYGSASQTLDVTTLDGEPVFEAKSPFSLYEVASDGSFYAAHLDANQKSSLSRWEPQSKSLLSLSLKNLIASRLMPLPTPGQLLYVLQSKAQHLKLVYYDWNTNQERWSRELKVGVYTHNASLSVTAEGFLLSTLEQKHWLLDAFTGTEKVVPLSHKGPMFASKEAILLVKGQQLLAYSWK